jgi:hypothetical protein
MLPPLIKREPRGRFFHNQHCTLSDVLDLQGGHDQDPLDIPKYRRRIHFFLAVRAFRTSVSPVIESEADCSKQDGD